MACKCKIKTVLRGDDAGFIKNLFRLLKKDGPKGELIGVIAQNAAYSCSFRYSWGKENYCDNQQFIKQLI